MSIVAFVNARGGSKRLPGKNVASLDGRPLIAHTCEAALASGVLDAVYVNTDCPEIAAAAAEAGVSAVVPRPAEMAADASHPRESIVYMLEELARRGEEYEAVLLLQPTSPLRQAEDIRNAVAIFEDNAPCAVIGVTPQAPTSWMGTLRADGQFERWTGDAQAYRINGAIYLHRVDDYRADRTPRKTMAYVMPNERSVDIDDALDFAWAEFLLQRQACGARRR